MVEKRTAVLLINVGSPKKAEKKYVKKFLKEFLNDKEVIDIPWLLRKILVNFVIVPFRSEKSTALYKRLWTKNGSPLIYFSQNIREKLNKITNNNTDIFYGMRYGEPSISDSLKKIKKGNFSKLIIFPLYPQYSTSTTKSAINAVLKIINAWENIPETKIIKQFYNHTKYIEALCAKINEYNIKEYDHIIFSYHGLPIRHINKIHPNIHENECNCAKQMPEHGHFCYKACCYETTRIIAKKLKLKNNIYSSSFQSHLSNKWTKPFTSDIIIEKAKKGYKKLLIVAPSFVSDCLETSVEIAYDYNYLFRTNGGQKLQLVESLNDSDKWVDSLKDIIEQY
jgi:ferrochelatase